MRLDPDNAKCRNHIKIINRQEDAKEKGNAAFKAGNNQEAVNQYTNGIDLDPHNKTLSSTLFANRAAAYMKLKKFTEALADCNKAIALNENYAKAYLRRGEVRMELDDYEDATRDFNRADQLDPSKNSTYFQTNFFSAWCKRKNESCKPRSKESFKKRLL